MILCVLCDVTAVPQDDQVLQSAAVSHSGGSALSVSGGDRLHHRFQSSAGTKRLRRHGRILLLHLGHHHSGVPCPYPLSIYHAKIYTFTCILDRLIGLVVKASASRAEDPGFESRLCRGRVIPVT